MCRWLKRSLVPRTGGMSTSLPGSLSAPMYADTASFAACGSAAAALLPVHKAFAPADEHLAAALSRPPSVGRPSSQNMRPSGATVGAPSPMDWLTMSSEEMGDAQAPPGASFRAAAMAATPMCRLPGAACCLLCRKWHSLGSAAISRAMAVKQR